jgi:lipopolysaccharide export system permease protein
MAYSNLLSVAQAWVAQGKLEPTVGFWVVHAGMLAITVALFSRNAFALSWPRIPWPSLRRSR